MGMRVKKVEYGKMVKIVKKMVGALKKRDGEKEMEFVKVCEMFEEMEKVKLDRAKLFRMLEKRELARTYMIVEERPEGVVYVEKCMVGVVTAEG